MPEGPFKTSPILLFLFLFLALAPDLGKRHQCFIQRLLFSLVISSLTPRNFDPTFDQSQSGKQWEKVWDDQCFFTSLVYTFDH